MEKQIYSGILQVLTFVPIGIKKSEVSFLTKNLEQHK